MSNSIFYKGDSALHWMMSDLGVNYALSPVYRIGFEIDDAGLEKLAIHYQDRVFRARKWYDRGQLSWSTLLLRFDERTFLVANGDGGTTAEIVAPTSAQAAELLEELRKVLDGEARPKQPAFYMLRYDSCDITADPIENLP